VNSVNQQQEKPTSDRFGCPHLDGFDPVEHETVVNPYPWLERARHECPVFYMPKYDQYVITRYEDLLEIYRDPISYSNVGSHDVRPAVPDELKHRVPDGKYQSPIALGQLNVSDPPQHTRLRKLMQKAFTPKHLEQRAPEIKQIAERLVDAMVADGKPEANYVTRFASPLPIRVVSGILGMLPEADETWRRWSDDWFRLTGATEENIPHAELVERFSRMIDFDEYLKEFVAKRRRSPREDLASDLIHARTDDGQPSMTDGEALANIMGVVLAGADTTAILLSHILYNLLEDRSRWEAVRQNRELVTHAVEETMRLMGPVRGLRRTTMRDVELGGVRIPKGSTLYIHIGSGSRDEQVFDDPNTFDLHRSNKNKHLGFGIWTHFCIGAPLARLEARVALNVLLDRVPDIRIAPRQGRLDYLDNMVLPSVREFWVAW
jgi:cytochrome P450